MRATGVPGMEKPITAKTTFNCKVVAGGTAVECDAKTKTAMGPYEGDFFIAYDPPIEKAEPGLAGITAGFAEVTDSFSTNSHYCISVIGIVEAVVLGVVSTDARRGR
jgi:hypothetical protein